MPTKAGPYSRSAPRVTRDRSVDSIGNPTGARSPAVSRSSNYGGVAGASSRFQGPGMAAGSSVSVSTALAVGQGPGTVAGVGFATGISTTAFVGAKMVAGVGSSAGTASANATGSDGSGSFIPPDRNFAWAPGLMTKGGASGAGIAAVGGSRTQFGATLTPTGGDDTTAIQTAVDNCPAGQVVKLGSGVFLVSTFIFISKAITLRGSGPQTTIIRMNVGGATPRTATNIQGTTIKIPGQTSNPTNNSPIILVGPGQFSAVDNGNQGSLQPASTSNLTADGIAGATSITVADASGFTVGACVLLDEVTGGTYQSTPRGFLNNNTDGTEGTVTVFRGDRVVGNMHVPTQTFQDDPPDAFGWFSRASPVNVVSSAYTDGRVTNEIKEIASKAGNTITFTSPLAITYRVSHVAQLTKYSSTPSTGNSVHLQFAGVEDLTVHLGGGGGIAFNCAAYCWAKHIEVQECFGLGVAFSNSFRCELRDSYIHTSAQPTPAADSYGICLMNGTSEMLIENNISRDYCKVIAARACGTGSVVAYNYFDDGFDWYGTGDPVQDGNYAAIAECGANASHLMGCHHVLFEGNYAWNFDSDYTHGNSIYMTAFRNQFSGSRASFTNETELRCAGGATFSWYLSYIGNILGKSGAMTGWVYTDPRMGCDAGGSNCVTAPSSGWTSSTGWAMKAIYVVGYDPERWPANSDLQTQQTLIRDGNYDYLTNSQKWHTTPATFTIPNSMYLSAKPAFFGANTWPWVNPGTGVLNTLPAKARYDGGTPNIVP